MKYDLVVFDLDGTTLNTLADLTNACNAALRHRGFPSRSLEEIRLFIGSGIARLIGQSLPKGTSPEICDETLEAFKQNYAEHVNDLTCPYPGIVSLLKKVKDAGIHIAINSNKVDSAVQILCASHFPGLYEMALGEQPGIPRKPSPEGVQRIMTALGADPARTLYVGDSQTDLETAKNAGIDCAWVSWGLRHRAELGDVDVQHAFDDSESLAKFILED